MGDLGQHVFEAMMEHRIHGNILVSVLEDDDCYLLQIPESMYRQAGLKGYSGEMFDLVMKGDEIVSIKPKSDADECYKAHQAGKGNVVNIFPERVSESQARQRVSKFFGNLGQYFK